ncbi:MAG: sugar transferase [Lachnospiraceae bacterium]|nr:sugar transferase [Lachnospiraceae bacterium]
MFQREALIRRYGFLLIDLVCIVAALVLANLIRFRRLQLHDYGYLYVQAMVVAMVACAFGYLALGFDHKLFERGAFQEFLAVLKNCLVMAIAVMTYLFFSQEGINYSRLQMAYFFPIFALTDYVLHLLAKRVIVQSFRGSAARKRILLVTSSDKAEQVLDQFARANNWYFALIGIVLVDRDAKGEKIRDIPVIANYSDMVEVSKGIVLDGVFINTSYASHATYDVRTILHEFQSLGVVVHVNIDALELDVSEKKIENLGFFKVVSYASRLREPSQMIIKRLIDIIGAVIGLAVTLVVSVFVVPAIMIESPGSPVFAQERVGRNGRHFRMYKFRSMVPDADRRKKELMEKNEMQGAMFKMEDDPRVTKVGRFIRKYSIDELPQFWNVLKGDMSLVGTRPPTVDEVERYRVEHKRRLSVTPGITGLWQTSGRSDIYDFDEIVRLDLQYIDQWSLLLDAKLILKTIGIVLAGKGAR